VDDVSMDSREAHWEAELRALRQELRELKAQQEAMAQAINQLVTTFRSLATHLGIAAEPYQPKGTDTRKSDLSGFA
jgi:chromosome segregation ATPase